MLNEKRWAVSYKPARKIVNSRTIFQNTPKTVFLFVT